MCLTEDMQLEKELTAAVRTKPARSVTEQQNAPFWPIGYIQADPNHVVSEYPHGDVIREKLRSRAKDSNADPADRQSAAGALRVIYRETL